MTKSLICLSLLLTWLGILRGEGGVSVIVTTPPDAKVDLASSDQEISLKCENPNNPNAVFKWYKVRNGEEKEVKSKGFKVNNGEMEVSLDALVNVQVLRCKDDNQNKAEFVISGQRKYNSFRVEPLPKSLSVLESRDLNITCKIVNQTSEVGDINVQWFYWDTVEDLSFFDDSLNCSFGSDKWKLVTETVEREDESEGSEPKFSLHSAGGIDGSLLRIVSADKRERRSRGGSRSHRRGYKCVATMQIKGDDKEVKCAATFVRVKDTLAALWPFLGIVVEVIILCAIIFMFERHVFVDKEVEDDLNTKTKSSPAKNGKSSLKHRKTEAKTPEKKVEN